MKHLTNIISKTVIGIVILVSSYSLSFAADNVALLTKIQDLQKNPSKKVDWAKIDAGISNNSASVIAVNNYPVDKTRERIEVSLPYKKFKYSISQAQARRISLISWEYFYDSLIPKLKDQLEDDLVAYEFHFEPPENKSAKISDDIINLSDEEVVKNFRLYVFTRTNIAEDSHEYAFQSGLAMGYSIPIEIVPIVIKNKEQIPARIKMKTFTLEDNYYNAITKNFVKKYGGEWENKCHSFFELPHGFSSLGIFLPPLALRPVVTPLSPNFLVFPD